MGGEVAIRTAAEWIEVAVFEAVFALGELGEGISLVGLYGDDRWPFSGWWCVVQQSTIELLSARHCCAWTRLATPLDYGAYVSLLFVLMWLQASKGLMCIYFV